MPVASAQETAFTDEIELRFPYSPALIDRLKVAVPARHRRWDPDDQVWRVTAPYQGTAIDLLIARFPNAEIPTAYAARHPLVTQRLKREASRCTTAQPEDRTAAGGPDWGEPWWHDATRTPPDTPPEAGSAALDVRIALRAPDSCPAPDDVPPVVIVIPCPKCGDRREQPIRVVAETSTKVARQERPPAELLSVCSHCNTLAVVSFQPAVPIGALS
jgi:hypothetical protein